MDDTCTAHALNHIDQQHLFRTVEHLQIKFGPGALCAVEAEAHHELALVLQPLA